jgi:hypothetical protein
VLGHHLREALSNDDLAPVGPIGTDAVGTLLLEIDRGIQRVDPKCLGVGGVTGQYQLDLAPQEPKDTQLILGVSGQRELL